MTRSAVQETLEAWIARADVERAALAYAVLTRLAVLGSGREIASATETRRRLGELLDQLLAAAPVEPVKILLVEGDPSVAAVIPLLLGEHFAVTPAVDVGSAIVALRSGTRFEVVLCDVIAAEAGGLRILRWIRKYRPSLTGGLLFMTTSPELAVVEVLRFWHPRLILRKPFSAAVLLAAVGAARRLVWEGEAAEPCDGLGEEAARRA